MANIIYKSFSLSYGDRIGNEDREFLNKKFEDGWQYVDSITQPAALTGNSYNSEFGSVLVILKKENDLTL